ncbi:Glycoside hydrolase, family 5 [Dillenia turbinata]|uniref:mannan endo-1,4-beta-mannosidase n=1 Tax=Dillenia turbinata TaxID=194707 RepID=A0AAN8VY67_9MAGN
MVNFLGIFLLLVGLISTPGVFASSPRFIQTRGTQFVLNGSSFLFNGFNSYWMMHIAADPSQRNKVSEVLHQASAAGLSVCRTWAFSDGGYQALQISPGVYDERVFQGLDFVISEARKYGVRLIMSLVNNFKDFGGRSQYVQWAKSAGVMVNNDDDFYTNDIIKGYYKNHAKRVIRRINTITGVAYKDDPTIMAWELMNEPRCQVDISGKTVNGWVQEMATYVKSIDSNHLLEVGMEGFYGDSIPDRKQYNPGYEVGTDFITSHMIGEIDFTTIHAYPSVWLPGQNEEAQMAFVQRWLKSHWTDSKTIIKKPMVFAEFGKSKKDPGYNTSVRDSFLSTIYDSIYKLARSGLSIGGGLVWQVMPEGLDSYYDGYEIILSKDLSTVSVMSKQSRRMADLVHSI